MRRQFGPILGHWTANNGPLYKSLADAVLRAIDRGDLVPGDLLPAERQLADELSISRSTAVAAYTLLSERGLVQRRQGSGTRITGPATPSVMDRLTNEAPNPIVDGLLRSHPDVVDLAPATLDCSPAVTQEYQKLIECGLGPLMIGSGYAPAGLDSLREALADWFTDVGRDTTAQNVLVTAGGQQGIWLLSHLLVQPGDAVITEDVTYPGALDCFRASGARIFGARTDAQGVDPQDLEELVIRVRPTLIHLNPTYQNPTGTVVSPARRLALVEIARRYRVPMVEDMATSRLHLNDSPQTAVPLYAHPGGEDIIVVDSLGKTFWGGMRVGWIRATPGMITRLARVKATVDLSGDPVSQQVAVGLLGRMDEECAARRLQLQAGYAELTRLIDTHLPGWSYRRPDGGLSLWVRLPEGSSSRAFAPLAMRHGVSITTGPNMSAHEEFDCFVRLPMTASPIRMRAGIQRLGRAWAEYDPRRHRVALGQGPF